MIALRLSLEGGVPASRDGSGRPPSSCRGGFIESRQLDLCSVALFFQEALVSEGLRKRLLMFAMHDCLAGTDDPYNRLLLGDVNGTEDLVASAMSCTPDVWLDPLLGSRNNIRVVVSIVVDFCILIT